MIVESEAPSPALRAVPLPRFAGADKKDHSAAFFSVPAAWIAAQTRAGVAGMSM
jgi:hypothetical protein